MTLWMLCTKQEGIEKETLDIKGLEFMKANFPPILGDFFNDILQQVLKGGEKDNILEQIKIFIWILLFY